MLPSTEFAHEFGITDAAAAKETTIDEIVRAAYKKSSKGKIVKAAVRIALGNN